MAAGLAISRGSIFGISDFLMEFSSGATLAAGDLVNLESGELAAASASDFLIGQTTEAATSSSTGVAVNVTRGLKLIMDNDNVGTTFAVTHVGAGFDITGATGAQIVDTSTLDQTYTGLATHLRCLAYNPQDVGFDSDVSVGAFVIAQHQNYS